MENEYDDEIDTTGNNSSSDSDVSGSDGDNLSEETEQIESDGSDQDFDYAAIANIDTNVDSLVLQIDNLNENVNVLNENIKFGIGLLFVVVFCLMIRFAYHIIGSILGLNKA